MKCIIIGLGTYGRVLADEMSALGHEVIAADSDASRVERVKDICDAAFQIDACDELALNVLPLKKVDVVIVAIGSNLGASVRVVALLKKQGVNHIYARANDYVHKSILQAFDIEKILIPEERAARSLVRQMDLGVKTDLFRVDEDRLDAHVVEVHTDESCCTRTDGVEKRLSQFLMYRHPCESIVPLKECDEHCADDNQQGGGSQHDLRVQVEQVGNVQTGVAMAIDPFP